MANKKELQKELDKLGIEYDPKATNAELEDLILSAEVEGDEGEEEEVDDEIEVVDDEDEDAVIPEDGFSVFDQNGKYVRTYTEELHGKGAKKLAIQFAKKIAGTIK